MWKEASEISGRGGFPNRGTEKSLGEWNHVEGKGVLKGEKKKAEPATIKVCIIRNILKKAQSQDAKSVGSNKKRRGFR